MSPIRPGAARPRKPGEPGIHSLDHFALAVPNLDDARAFYSAFGLDARTDGNSLGINAFGAAHRWIVLREGAAKRLEYLSFGVFEEDFEPFAQRLQTLGVRREDPPPGVATEGLWIRDPDGTRLELRVAPKTSPDSKLLCEFASSPAGTPGAPKRSLAPVVRPSGLSHCLLFTRDVNATLAFYERVLGLRLSDRSGDDIAFMHGIHGSNHHLVAFARSNAPGLHHCAWDVRSLNEIGHGAMQMADKGYVAGWGLGRHVLGSNYFHYVRDPWNSYSEYSADMDYIPADQDWVAGNHDGEDAFYVWGPNPPADWTHNHEADRL